jgi:hypothetical protein
MHRLLLRIGSTTCGAAMGRYRASTGLSSWFWRSVSVHSCCIDVARGKKPCFQDDRRIDCFRGIDARFSVAGHRQPVGSNCSCTLRAQRGLHSRSAGQCTGIAKVARCSYTVLVRLRMISRTESNMYMETMTTAAMVLGDYAKGNCDVPTALRNAQSSCVMV